MRGLIFSNHATAILIAIFQVNVREQSREEHANTRSRLPSDVGAPGVTGVI
jgi:hypothetical protein